MVGEHASGQDHKEAVALLKQVDSKLSVNLSTVLSLKARTSYGAERATPNHLKQVELFIQAGIAAADVVCCVQLGEHAGGSRPMVVNPR
ncbi:MAG: hypothetical protein R2704_07350 [Microthrixaceae bacterium]